MPGMKSVVGMGGTGNARELAEMLRQLGRGRDTVLAHITPEEAQMLMDMGGSGEMNPNTGLPEFQQDFYDYGESYGNVTGAPVDYSYMAPESVSIESNYPRDMTGFRQPTGFGQAFEPQPESMAGLSPELQRSVAEMPPGMRFDIAPQVSPFQREVPGIVPREFLPAAPEQPGMMQTAAQAVENTAQQFRNLANQYPTVAKMLSTGATTLPALIQAARARRQSEAAAEQFRRLGEPLRAQGEAMRQQAMAGQLSPQQAARQEARRASLRQAAATRGATSGTQQAMIEGRLEAERAQLTESNYNNALKQLNLGNAYEEAAIKAKLAGDQEIANSVANIFANLGRDITSQAPRQQQAPVQTAGLSQQPEVTRRPEIRG